MKNLLTPAHWNQYIWILIYLVQGISCIAQMTITFRRRPIVQEKVLVSIMGVSIFQICWWISFCLDRIVLSFVFSMITILFLSLVLTTQSLVIHRRRSPREFFLFQFPYHVHYGWFLIITAANIAIFVRKFKANVATEFAISLILLHVLMRLCDVFSSDVSQVVVAIALVSPSLQ